MKADIKTIVSDNASKYFNDHNITSLNWSNYCRELFNLERNKDYFYIVFYEGNSIGYTKRFY